MTPHSEAMSSPLRFTLMRSSAIEPQREFLLGSKLAHSLASSVGTRGRPARQCLDRARKRLDGTRPPECHMVAERCGREKTVALRLVCGVWDS